MKNGSRNSAGIFTIAIVALFMAGFLMLVIFGAQAYKGTVGLQNDNREARALLAYVQTSVKDNDTKGAVSIEKTELGSVLSIADGDTGYSVKIYASDGKMMEYFGKTEAPIDVENSQVIGDTAVFELDMPENDVLTVKTDEGKVFIKLRSEEGDGK